MNIYDFMHGLPVESQGEQVDAVTVTAVGLQGKIAIGLVLESVKDYIEEQKRLNWYFQGAKGWQAGSVRVAEKFDDHQQKVWSICMVTGEMSRDAFRVAVKLEGLKFTRVDLAVDVFLYEPVEKIARMLKDSYKGKHKLVLYESDTGDTLYVGSRKGESYLRIYDKSGDYGLAKGRVWRWEVEYKGGLAPIVAQEVADGGLARLREMVFEEARHKDVPSPFIGAQRGIKRSRISVSTPEMKLAWLERQVAPTVKWLNALGLNREVSNVLQLTLPGYEETLK